MPADPPALNVGLDASVMFSSVGGTRVYAAQLVRSLLEERPGWSFHLYTRTPDQARALGEEFASGKVSIASVPGSPNAWRVQGRLPRRLRDDRIDVYHSLGYFLPLRWPGPKVVTIHDLNMYLNWRSWMRRRTITSWADLAIQTPLSAALADRIITDSAFSRRSICRVLRVPEAKVAVVPLAPDAFFDGAPEPEELAAARAVAGRTRFVLAVGVLAPQKNLGTLIRAFARAGLDTAGAGLVLAGSDRAGYGATLRSIAKEVGVASSVVMTGFVTRETLRALYHDAECVVQASHGEGFGLPLVEAMAAGAPVVAANRQSLPEVVGDAGVLFDPDSVEALANALRRIHDEPEYRRALAERGARRRADFSWHSAGKATAQIYEEVATRR